MACDFPPGWKLMPVEACMAAVIDYRGKSPRKVSSGIPLITAKIVKDGRILPPHEYVAEEEYDEWMRRGIPETGDVLLTTEAPLGEVAQLDGRKVALAQRLITLRGRSDILDNRFLKFAMQTDLVQRQLRARATGTTVHGIRQSELRKVQLPIPPLCEQRAIAHVLGTLDDKIELNRRRNETLEAMARALFKAWFVEFEPVRAKMDGRWKRGQSLPGLPAHLYDLFPDRLADSELGEIPELWCVGTLGDVAVHPRRGVRPEHVVASTPYIALEHMPKRCIALSEWTIAEGIESNKFEFRKGEILFGKLRPYFHKVGIAAMDGVCSTDIVVVAPRSRDWYGFVLGHVSSEALVDYTSAGSTGTKMPRTSWAEMARYPVAIPPESVAGALTARIQPMMERIITSIHESRTLAALRDVLLPRLISGEFRIKDSRVLYS